MVRTRVGYAGGTLADPTYRRLGDHSETIEVDYDPSVITYADLLDVFWANHDARRAPFSTQYRSAVFYRTEEELAQAEASRSRIEGVHGRVSTAIEPLDRFYRAEAYHQKYVWKHDPYLAKTFPLVDDHSLWAVATAMGVPIGEIQKQTGARWEQPAGRPLP